MATGDFPAQDPRLAATAVVGAVSEVIVGPLAPAVRRRAEVDAILAQTVALACRAVIGHAGPAPTGRAKGGGSS